MLAWIPSLKWWQYWLKNYWKKRKTWSLHSVSGATSPVLHPWNERIGRLLTLPQTDWQNNCVNRLKTYHLHLNFYYRMLWFRRNFYFHFFLLFFSFPFLPILSFPFLFIFFFLFLSFLPSFCMYLRVHMLTETRGWCQASSVIALHIISWDRVCCWLI